ncbi:MAG TPA: aminotransferase class V-fold PLP-dependent enzyme [bacterium]|nr:aminotransferase class V-fold PLP-dependent enzyme [bacterium]
MELEAARDLFPFVTEQLYLNHAASSPLSLRVEEAIRRYVSDRTRGGINNFKRDMQEIAALRSALAELIGADPERIALTSNTTHGLNIIASGLSWSEGDEILLSEMEFPANVYPFLNLRRQGVTIKHLPSTDGKITIEDFAEHTTERTRLISLSYVQYLNGYRADLTSVSDFCNANDILFIVDAIQGLGAIPLDVDHIRCDALATGGHKWLMSPRGTGFLYLSEALQERLTPAYLGWLSVENPFHFHDYKQKLKPTAEQFELATPNTIGAYGMHAAVQLLQEVGLQKIERHILDITGYLRNELPKRGYEVKTTFTDQERAGILLFSCGDPQENKRIFGKLSGKNVTISYREGALRVAPHFYNTRADMDRFIGILEEVS